MTSHKSIAVVESQQEAQFDPGKAGASAAPLAKWLAKRTLAEKVVAVVALRLQDADTQSELRDAGAYDGEIGNDLLAAWEQEVENADLDDEQRNALSMTDLFERLA